MNECVITEYIYQASKKACVDFVLINFSELFGSSMVQMHMHTGIDQANEAKNNGVHPVMNEFAMLL